MGNEPGFKNICLCEVLAFFRLRKKVFTQQTRFRFCVRRRLYDAFFVFGKSQELASTHDATFLIAITIILGRGGKTTEHKGWVGKTEYRMIESGQLGRLSRMRAWGPIYMTSQYFGDFCTPSHRRQFKTKALVFSSQNH